MILNKQEQTVIIGKLINNILGLELVKEHIYPQKLEKVVFLHNEISDDMTPKQCREAMVSVLSKTVDEFLKGRSEGRYNFIILAVMKIMICNHT